MLLTDYLLTQGHSIIGKSIQDLNLIVLDIAVNALFYKL